MDTMLGMVNKVIPQENVITIVGIFFVYSILGWAVESAYMSICNKRITNRGFIKGPICPIYGVGEFIVYTLISPFAGDNYIAIFFMGTALATTLEFFTAKAMIHRLGYVWWDYTNKPFNYKGILCLESTVAWGFYAVIEFAFLREVVTGFVGFLPFRILTICVVLLSAYYMCDLAWSLRRIVSGRVSISENNLMAYHKETSSRQKYLSRISALWRR